MLLLQFPPVFCPFQVGGLRRSSKTHPDPLGFGFYAPFHGRRSEECPWCACCLWIEPIRCSWDRSSRSWWTARHLDLVSSQRWFLAMGRCPTTLWGIPLSTQSSSSACLSCFRCRPWYVYLPHFSSNGKYPCMKKYVLNIDRLYTGATANALVLD